VDRNGVIQLDEFELLISKPTRLVSIMLANHETGVLQPVQQASQMCRQRGILFHTDAVQAVGKINVNFAELGVDAMTFTAHKFHGPRGIGGLLVRDGVTPSALIFGGFQQLAIRPGTEDVALAAGLHQALKLFRDSGDNRTARMRQLRDRLESNICQACAGVVSNGAAVSRVPQTLSLSLPGIDRQAFLMAADIAGLAISTGSACASGSSDPSPVLLAMGASDRLLLGSIRISLGAQTTAQEIDTASARIIKLFHEMRGQKSI
jgi:cysteine desulfurase